LYRSSFLRFQSWPCEAGSAWSFSLTDFCLSFFSVIAFVAGSLGGSISTTSYYLVLVPVLATLLLGVRPGIIWLLVVALTFFVMVSVWAALPAPTYDIIDNRISAPEVSAWNAIALTLIACAATFLVAIFQRATRRSSDLLVEAALDARKSEQALQAAEDVARSRSEFVANMSHELRTPLNAIIGYGEMLRESAEIESRSDDVADSRQLLDAAARLKAMVDGVLQLSANDALRVEVVECDLDSLIRDAVLSIQTAAASNGNTFAIELPHPLGGWRCDDQKLDRCLRNLLSNAAKFTRGGRIIVRAWAEMAADQCWLRFEVSDTGIGIDPAHIGLLFKPFSVVDSSFTRAEQGAGLGLAIARRLAQATGGDISVKSALGEGSTFTLSFPASRVLERQRVAS
jgi:signal transduction histidine kinase